MNIQNICTNIKIYRFLQLDGRHGLSHRFTEWMVGRTSSVLSIPFLLCISMTLSVYQLFPLFEQHCR